MWLHYLPPGRDRVNRPAKICEGIAPRTLGFLAKISFTPLLYHPGGCLGVQRSGQAQGTIIYLFGPLFFSQNGITLKKPTKVIKIH